MLHLNTTADLDSLLADRDSWNALTRGVPFRSAEWLGAWWHHYRDGRQPYVVTAHDDTGRLRGALPLHRSADGPRRSVLRNLADGDACTDYVSILADPADADEVAARIAGHLVENAGDDRWGWEGIEIDGVVEGDRAMHVFAQTLCAADAATHARSRMSTWSRATADSWDQHLQQHGKSQRRKMRALCHALDSDPRLQPLTVESEPNVHRLLNELSRLHQRRWAEAGESGSYADPRFVEFVRSAASEFWYTGSVYLTALAKADRVIAVELNFIGDDRVLYCYSSGFDLEFADLEPGRVLGIDTLQHLYRAGLSGIDFLRGDETYKQRLANSSRRLFRLRIVAPRWYPKLRHTLWNTQFELTNLARRHSGRTPIAVVDFPGAADAQSAGYAKIPRTT